MEGGCTELAAAQGGCGLHAVPIICHGVERQDMSIRMEIYCINVNKSLSQELVLTLEGCCGERHARS
jgi:hypothetical protein